MSHADCGKGEDLISLMLSKGWRNEIERRQKFFDMANAIVQSSRQFDYYEEDPRAWSLGHDSTGARFFIVWGGHNWSVENFLSLLISFENRRREVDHLKKLSYSACSDTNSRDIEEGDSDPDMFSVDEDEYGAMDRVSEDRLEALKRSADGHMKLLEKYDDRDFCLIALFVVLVALDIDTRARRACFKNNNFLLRNSMSWPDPITIRSFFIGLNRLLAMHVSGELTIEELIASLWDMSYTANPSSGLGERSERRKCETLFDREGSNLDSLDNVRFLAVKPPTQLP